MMMRVKYGYLEQMFCVSTVFSVQGMDHLNNPLGSLYMHAPLASCAFIPRSLDPVFEPQINTDCRTHLRLHPYVIMAFEQGYLRSSVSICGSFIHLERAG